MYKMPCYEAKYFPKNYWEEISDIELMDGLYKIYNKITPVIKEMIQGKEIQIADAVYRLKWIGGDNTSTDGMDTCQQASGIEGL